MLVGNWNLAKSEPGMGLRGVFGYLDSCTVTIVEWDMNVSGLNEILVGNPNLFLLVYL